LKGNILMALFLMLWYTFRHSSLRVESLHYHRGGSFSELMRFSMW